MHHSNYLQLFCLFGWLLSLSECQRLGSSSSSPHQRPRILNEFFCFLGVCANETEATSNNNNTAKTPAPFGSLCVPLFGQCPDGTDNLDYSDCQNRTDGLLGGRPIFGECGYVTEVVDGFVGAADTDGDGKTDAIQLESSRTAVLHADDTNSTNVTTTKKNPSSWLQIFPPNSIMWEIFGGSNDIMMMDPVAMLESGSSSLMESIAPFAVNWKPNYSNFTGCHSNTTTASNNSTNTTGVSLEAEPKSCRTPLGNEGIYVCRTLYDPYTAEPANKTICIDPDNWLISNDGCGCCGGACPEDIVQEQCKCRCNLYGVNDGLYITSDSLAEERCVTKEHSIATVGQQLDIECSTTCQTQTPLQLKNATINVTKMQP